MNRPLSDYQRAFVDLVDRTAVFAREDPIAYGRIRAALEPIRRWFADRTGWPVLLNRELARLVKIPAAPSAGHGFRWAQSPLDYELFTWVLWFADSNGADQFLLSQLIQEIEHRANVLLGPGHIDWDSYATRLAMARALKSLEAMQVLVRVHGETEEWVASGRGDTLYEFTPLASYLTVELPPGAGEPDFEVPPALVPLPGQGDARQRLYRTLLLDPALYRASDPEAFELLRRREARERIALDLRETLGWDLEVTDSFAAVLRPTGSAAADPDLFPIRGALGHVVLLIGTELRGAVQRGELRPDACDRLRISEGQLAHLVSRLRQRHGANWGATLGRKSEPELVREVLAAMRGWDFVTGPDADGQLTVYPALARYAAAYGADTGVHERWAATQPPTADGDEGGTSPHGPR